MTPLCLLFLIAWASMVEGVIRYTVEFDSTDPSRQKAFLDYLDQQHINVTVRYRFSTIMNGMSVELAEDPIQPSNRHAIFLAQTLKKCPYIFRYWPGKRYARPNVIRAAVPLLNVTTKAYVDPGLPNIGYAHILTGANLAKQAGWTGHGIKVGILDSGVDYMHPALGGCFGKEHCLVRYGYDLVGDNYGDTTNPTPDDDPRDLCDGHGTHVAGILAANDTLKGFEGVAPGVTLGAWRIFGCHGDTDDDIILAAAEMAAVAGMDVINLSLGGGVSAWGEDALAVALSNLADRGIMIVVAQGNEGRDGIARTPSPAIGEHVLAVGSVDNTYRYGNFLRIYHKGDELGNYEYALTGGSTFLKHNTDIEFTTLTRHYINKKSTIDPEEQANETACGPISQDVAGKVVLVKRGGCDEGQKAMQVQTAGGLGVLMYNGEHDLDDNATLDLHQYPLVRIPVAFLRGQDCANLLRHYFGTGGHASRMSMRFVSHGMAVKSAGLMSTFSTWGPDPELHVKPDISGVGGSMYSTFPVGMGSYTTMSGTSMATPYISGCVALLMQATGKALPVSIIRHLLNHAKPVYASDEIHLDSIAKQGAGLVQIYDSILASTKVLPYKIALNDTDHFQPLTQLLIENTSNVTKKYQLEHLPAVAVSGYDFKKSAVPLRRGKYQVTNGFVQFEQDSFTLKPTETKNITVHFQPPPLDPSDSHDPPSPLIFSGFLQIRPMSTDNATLEDKPIHVPYFGVLGNQHDLPILDIVQGYPYIGNGGGTPIHPDDSRNAPITIPTYNFELGEKLHIFIRLGSPTALLKCEVIKKDVNNKETVIGYVSRFHNAWVPRNDHGRDNYDYSVHWNGQVALDYRGSLSPSAAAARAAEKADTVSLLSSSPIKTYPVDPGVYHLRLSALKIFGDANNKEDWESWDSLEFGIIG